MRTSSLATESATAKNVKITGDTLAVELRDGRTVTVPISWYPRLAEGRPAERRDWQLIGRGIGIHWPALDEDISVGALLQGLGSHESRASLQRWRVVRRRPAHKRIESTRSRSRRRAARS